MDPLVTIAIPTFNRCELLAQTLDCALGQDYPLLDILVSDNGSTDETASLVRSLQRNHRNLRYRRTPAPATIPQHFNQCLDAAKGDYFVLLSDDDGMNTSFVSSLVEAIREHPEAAVAIPSNALISQDGQILQRLPRASGCHQGVDFALDWLWRTKPLPVANLLTVMAPTLRIRQFGYQRFPNGLNSDNLLFLQLALSGKVVFQPESVFYFRVHEKSEGAMASPALVTEASQAFRHYLRHDPRTVSLLQRHPPEIQRAIRNGVRRMTAEEFLRAIGFFDPPLSWKTLRSLPAFRMDPYYLKMLFRHIVRRMRHRVLPKAELRSP